MNTVTHRDRFHRLSITTATAIALGLMTIWSANAPCHTLDGRDCMECHSARNYQPISPTETRPQFVDELEALENVHGQNGVACEHCHTEAVKLPHPEEMDRENCEDCHKKIAREYEATIHGIGREQNIKEAATCIDCHGAHDMYPFTDPRSHTHPKNVDNTCLRCHTSDAMAARFGFTRRRIRSEYRQSTHARMIAAGHDAAATCNDCHGTHDILPSKDPKSHVHRANIPQTCGQCHWIVLNEYKKSVHGQKLADGSSEVAVCNSCHLDHRIQRTETSRFKLSVVSECGDCHHDLLETYRYGYHGKVVQLGGTRTARCSDCHGDHSIRPVSDPASMVAPHNRVGTCRKCHPYANGKFASFMPHLAFDDKSHSETYYPYRFMTFLLMGTIGFFVLHSILWLIRESVDLLMRRIRGEAEGESNPTTYVLRFNWTQRLTHVTLFISVIGLALTGMPLRYSETNWAHWVFDMLGGYQVAGRLHRFFAALTVVYVGAHLVYLMRMWRRGPKKSLWERVFGAHSMIPRWTDFKQFFQHVRWFLFLGPHPRFGRWTYWEKFDYWAVFWGIMIIGSSGLVMAVLPVFAPILPGWMFNVALIIHSEEALLASSFLFLIHFHHVHFRPSKFPMDMVMFSGLITRREMVEERPLELEQLEAEGRLDEIVADPPGRRFILLGRVLGFIALSIGIALVICIIVAEYHHFFHS